MPNTTLTQELVNNFINLHNQVSIRAQEVALLLYTTNPRKYTMRSVGGFAFKITGGAVYATAWSDDWLYPLSDVNFPVAYLYMYNDDIIEAEESIQG